MILETTNEYGKIVISENAIAQIAGLTAMECYGVVGMATKNLTAGLVKLLGIHSMTRGIDIQIEEDSLFITLHVILSYGTSISAIGESIIQTVAYKVEQLTGLKVKDVKLMVEGIRI